MRYLCLTFGLLFLACAKQEQEKPLVVAKKPNNIYSLIFIDKTVSVSLKDTFTRVKYEKALQAIINQNVRQKDDKIEVFFVHENTSQAKVFAQTAKSEMKDTTGLNPTDVRAVKNSYQVALKKERNKMISKCIEALLDPNTTFTKQYTDIWAVLPIIDKRNAKKKENTQMKVYLLSDMVESMPGLERRDFYKRPPFSKQEAQIWAEKDAKKFQEIELEDVEIFYLLPFSPLSATSQNNPNVLVYWETLLNKLGLEEFKEFNNE
ncbi:MAG: hypothetical protein OHK0045_20410 [Raineya sp.]